MSSIVPSGRSGRSSGLTTGVSGALERREERALIRRLSALDRDRIVGLAEIEVKTQTQAARAHAVGYIGEQGMLAVSMLSQLEGQLGQVTPLAVTRLQGIADMTALGIAQVVANAVREVSE